LNLIDKDMCSFFTLQELAIGSDRKLFRQIQLEILLRPCNSPWPGHPAYSDRIQTQQSEYHCSCLHSPRQRVIVGTKCDRVSGWVLV
jgi:hypothetical protein